MSMGISGNYGSYASSYSANYASSTNTKKAGENKKSSTVTATDTKQASKSAGVAKPTWDGHKVYKYLEDFGDAAIDYGKRAVKYYSTITEQDGEMTVDELKKQIGEMFSQYTFTNNDSMKMSPGKHYLYIDDSQMRKMAADPSYRAKVYGLMDREYTCGETFTLQYSDGRNVTEHTTASVFTLSEKNRKYAGSDGVPYLGGCMTDQPFSSSESHCQVRSMSFIYDHIDPAKSAAKERKTAAVKAEAEKMKEKAAAKKKAEKKRAEKKRAEKNEQKKLEEQKIEEQILEEEKTEEQAKVTQTNDFKTTTGKASKTSDFNAVTTGEVTSSDNKLFKNKKDFMKYLTEKYPSVKDGTVSISGIYLSKCMKDPEKLKELEQSLEDAEYIIKDSKENVKGYQRSRITIDDEGKMTVETQSKRVAVNEGKRMRQIAAAKTPDNIQTVMGLLTQDLADCEAGLADGSCDENEIQKVKALMQKAQQRMGELMGAGNKEEGDGFDSFSINLLM